jgi:phenylacetate-CoA ligase
MLKDIPPVDVALRTAGRLGRRARSDIDNFRDRQVRALVTHAYAKVPFYRRLYDEQGVSPSKVRGTADLQMLPRVSKHDFQGLPVTDRVATGLDISKLHVRRTTGTTGEPLTVYRTPAESRVLALYYFQAFRSLGVRRSDLATGISLPRPGVEHRYGFFRRLANHLGVYPIADVFAETPAEALAEFRRLRPGIIGGVPGRLSLFAASWSESERDFVRRAPWPRLVVTGGERLKQQVRSHLSDVFGAKVFDMYSNVEFSLIASECPQTGSYHVSDETVVLEILDGDRQVAVGETGRPVITALHAFGAPLIRYDVTDLVTMGTRTCECGVSHSTISEIQGRSIDFFKLPDGSLFHDVKLEEATAFAAPWTRQMQVRQQGPGVIVVKVAPLTETPVDGAASLRRYLENFLGNRATVEVIIDSTLGPAADEAKFRSMTRPSDETTTTR